MNEIFTHILTGKDNQTHDIARWAWMLGFVVVATAAIYLIYAGHEISLTELAGALALFLALVRHLWPLNKCLAQNPNNV